MCGYSAVCKRLKTVGHFLSQCLCFCLCSLHFASRKISLSIENEQTGCKALSLSEWAAEYKTGFNTASGLFQVGHESGRSLEQAVVKDNLNSLNTEVLELKRQLQEKTDSLTLHRQAIQRAAELNSSLTRELHQTHTNVDHLTESYIDILARNSFLEDRNQFYYRNYHGLQQDTDITGPLIDTEEKPPTQGPF